MRKKQSKKGGKLRVILITVIVLAVIGACAQGGGSDTDGDKESGKDKKVTAEKKDSGSKVSIEEQVIFDAEGVKITAKEYEKGSMFGDSVKLLIENTSDKDVGVGCTTLIVNDHMIENLFSETVAAGKSVNTTMDLYSSELEAAGIETVGKIETKFHLFNPEDYMTTTEGELTTIETSEIANMDTTANIEGTELVNEGGVRVLAKSVDEDSFWGAAVVLYIENTSGKNVIIQCDDLSVNDFMLTPLFSCEVYDGKKAVSDIALMSTELEENNIESIDKIELKLKLVNPDDYSTIKETDPIVIKNS